MTKLVKIYQEDFENVYELIKSFFPLISKETWKRLFIYQWERPEDYYGYAIFDGDKAVGFIATIFSYRIIKGNKYNFCNLSTWVVKEEYRGKSIAIIFPLLKLKDYTITVYSANQVASQIFKKCGFKLLSMARKFSASIQFRKSNLIRNCEVIYDGDAIKLLNDNELKIYNDHKDFKCRHLAILSNYGYSYLIIKRMVKKLYKLNFPVADVYYISNKDIFCRHFDEVRINLGWKLKVLGFTISDTYLKGYYMPYLIRRPAEALYRSNILTPFDIDPLYSELFILEHNGNG